MKKFLLLVTLLVGFSTLRGQWFSQYVTPDRHTLFSVKFLNEDIGWAVGGIGTIHGTTNGGANWSSIASGTDNNLYSISVLDDQNVFIVGSGGILFNLGNMSYPYMSNTDKDLRSIYFVDGNYGWAVGNSGTIIKTTDSGLNWSVLVSGVSDNLYDVFFIDHNIGWVAGLNGTILKTTDGGNNWTNQSFDPSQDFYSIFFIDNQTGWGAGYSKIYHTVNGGNNWTQQPTGSSNLYYSIYFIDSTGWVVTNQGVIFNTTNRGASWTRQLVSGQPYFSIPLFSVCFVNKYIGWAVGDGGIILKTINGGVTPVDKRDSEPTTFSLDNYPNPFKASTVIRWQTLAGCWQTLKIYDIFGKSITTLVDEYKPAGEHVTWFHADQLPDGIYFVLLKAGNYTSSRKILLVR